MRSPWMLMQGDTLLGTLTYRDSDFPWFYCHFQAEPIFEQIRPLFNKVHELQDRFDSEDWETWEKAYDAIDELHLKLVSSDGIENTEFLLYIAGENASFRF